MMSDWRGRFSALRRLLGSRRWAPVTTGQELADFVAAQTAYVAQRSVIEYCRARTGLNWGKLALERQFLDRLEVCRWEAYAIVLAEVAELALIRLRRDRAADRRPTCPGSSPQRTRRSCAILCRATGPLGPMPLRRSSGIWRARCLPRRGRSICSACNRRMRSSIFCRSTPICVPRIGRCSRTASASRSAARSTRCRAASRFRRSRRRCWRMSATNWSLPRLNADSADAGPAPLACAETPVCPAQLCAAATHPCSAKYGFSCPATVPAASLAELCRLALACGEMPGLVTTWPAVMVGSGSSPAG